MSNLNTGNNRNLMDVKNMNKRLDLDYNDNKNLYTKDVKPTNAFSNAGNGINKDSYNDNIQKFLSKQGSIKTDEPSYQKMLQKYMPNGPVQEEPRALGDGVINNIINSGQKLNDKNINSTDIVGSNMTDLVRDVYRNVSNVKNNMHEYAKDLFSSINNIQTDSRYDSNINKSLSEKGKLGPIKEYKGWSFNLSLPITKLLENSDKDGMISIGDYNDLMNEQMLSLQKSLQREAANPKIPEKQNFARRALEGVNQVMNANGFSFDPNTLKYQCGLIHKNMSDIYHNISVFDQIIMAIYNFFTFTDFYQDNTEIRAILDGLYNDIDSYYDVDFKNRQYLLNSIYERISRVEYLLSNIFLVRKEDLENLATIKNALEKSMYTKVDAVGVVVSMVRMFGQKALDNVDMNSIPQEVYNKLSTCLTSSIANAMGNNKLDAQDVSNILLKKGTQDDIDNLMLMGQEKKVANAFFKGKADGEYTFMMDKLNNDSALEDAKIKCNTNLRDVDTLSKTTDAVINAINIFVAKCNQEINDLRRNYSLVGTVGGNIQEQMISAGIREARQNMLSCIRNFTGYLKSRVYEYDDSPQIRLRKIRDAQNDLDQDKKDIRARMEKCLYKKGKPADGKEDIILEMNDMMANMGNLPKMKYDYWEQINNLEQQIEAQVRNEQSFVVTRGHNDVMSLIKNKANIENNLLKDLIDKGALNTQKMHTLRE